MTELIEMESAIDRSKEADEGMPFFTIIEGDVPMLLTAPHGNNHFRNGVLKYGEEFTSTFARYLAEQMGCSAIFTTHLSPEDGNWGEVGVFKSAVSQLVKKHSIHTLIDIHGMRNTNMIGVAIGTMNGQSYKGEDEMLLEPFVEQGFVKSAVTDFDWFDWRRIVLNHPKFTGGLKSNTLTRFASETLGISAFQIELTSAVRVPHSLPDDGWPYEYFGDPVAIQKSINALLNLIHSILSSPPHDCDKIIL